MNMAVENELKGKPPIPAGEYQVIVEDQGFKGFSPNKKGTGENLQLTYKVVGGEFDGRLIFANYCVTHTVSPIAQEISRKQLDGYLAAVGATNNDGETLTYETLPSKHRFGEYINNPLLVDVDIEKKAQAGFYPNNRITAFRVL